MIHFATKLLRKLGLLKPWRGVIVNDCRDSNAQMREETAFGVLLRCPTKFVDANNDITAGLHVMDALDALRGRPGIILANVARRDGKDGASYRNGSPFGAVWLNNTLIVATTSGYVMSFLKKLELVHERDMMVFDVEEVLRVQVRRRIISASEAKRIVKSQFRSYDFAPLLAQWLWKGARLPYRQLANIPDLPLCVAMIDNFGNLKTTVLPRDIEWIPGQVITLLGDHSHQITCYPRLPDIPEGELGLTIGSSGHGATRFLELQVRGGSASRRLGITVGFILFEPNPPYQPILWC